MQRVPTKVEGYTGLIVTTKVENQPEAKNGEYQLLKTEQIMRSHKPKSKKSEELLIWLVTYKENEQKTKKLHSFMLHNSNFAIIFSTSKSMILMCKLRLTPNQALHVTSYVSVPCITMLCQYADRLMYKHAGITCQALLSLYSIDAMLLANVYTVLLNFANNNGGQKNTNPLSCPEC